MKKILSLILFLLVSMPVQAGPLESYIANRQVFTDNYKKLEIILRSQIEKIERIAARRGTDQNLTPAELGKLIVEVSKASELARIPVRPMRSVREAFESVARRESLLRIAQARLK